MENLIQQKCFKHDQDFLAVQIAQENKDENKYFCPQCLIELITNKELILISQAKIQIENKKKEISKRIQEQCQEKINLISNIKKSIEELQCPIKQVFNSIIGEIEQLKSETCNQLQQSQILTSETQISDQDLKLLKDDQSSLSTQEEIDEQLKKQVFLQIKYSYYSQQLNEILKQFEKIASLHNDSFDNSDSTSEQSNPKDYKTISQKCKIHNQQLKMLKLDQNNKVQKYACIQCISETQGKYITPTQVQQSFHDYLQQSEKLLKYFQQLKKQSTSNKISLLNKIREMYIQNINQYIQQLEESEKSFKNIIETNLQYKDHNILLLEQELQLKILEPVYSKESPDNYYNIIKRELEYEKNLQIKFEESMQELIQFEIQNSNQIYIEQLEHQDLLKKLVNNIQLENLVQDNNLISEISKDDEEILNLEKQINSFLSKKMKICLKYNQLLEIFENRNILQIEEAQLIQKLSDKQKKLKAKNINCEIGKEQFQIKQEKQNRHLERLMTNINSTSFFNYTQKEITTQDFDKNQNVEKEINQCRFVIGRFEALKIVQNNSYFPQFDNSTKLPTLQLVNQKLIKSSQGVFGLAVIQPPLPSDKVSTFIFQINQSKSLTGIGICNLQAAKGFNYDMTANHQSKSHNAYLVCSNGYQISSKLGYTNTKFTFENNGIIQCEYNPMNLRLNFKHLNDGRTYQVDLAKNSLIMSPCVMLSGDAEIEIL
ncbi:unnamed protein product [Paramecium primaurelia]|uniref:Uncharacterized protein n=1 Tax=Paramecium primaurelia TaxID=5886 RepID=A0A8S1PPI9_PARPR|nr:unnamed protein product [Paramecium primaurelia]